MGSYRSTKTTLNIHLRIPARGLFSSKILSHENCQRKKADNVYVKNKEIRNICRWTYGNGQQRKWGKLDTVRGILEKKSRPPTPLPTETKPQSLGI